MRLRILAFSSITACVCPVDAFLQGSLAPGRNSGRSWMAAVARDDNNHNSIHLPSLLDEAVLLHSTLTNMDYEGEVTNLVEEICTMMHQLQRQLPSTSSSTDTRRQEDIQKELDAAILNFTDGDEKELVGKITSLADELYSINSKKMGILTTPRIESKEDLKEIEMISDLKIKLDTIKMKVSGTSVSSNPTNEKKLPPLVVENHTSESDQVVAAEAAEVITSAAEMSSIDKVQVDEMNSEISTDVETNISENKNEEISNLAEENEKLTEDREDEVEHVDVAIVGAGIGGLCAGAILNTLYGKTVGVYESHYLAGGCAHAFEHIVKKEDGEKLSFTFDSGPTIVLGCSKKPYNPLRQVLNAVGLGDEVDWMPYEAWGMVENPKANDELRWKVELGPDLFEQGPLKGYGGDDAIKEFRELKAMTKDLVSGAIAIPAMAMRPGSSALVPLLRYIPALVGLIKQGEEVTQGTFGQFMDGPKYVVKNKWFRDWLDALAFSLSGLPASRTSAAAMAYVLYDMHRDGAALDYPKGGLGAVIDALVKGVEQGDNNSKVNLRQHVDSIDTSPNGSIITGLTLRNGRKVVAKDGVICNAPVWSLNGLIKNKLAKKVLNDSQILKDRQPRQSWEVSEDGSRSSIKFKRPEVSEDDNSSLLAKCDTSEMTGSFLHLHVALDASTLDLDSLEAHYTVMARGLAGENDGADGDGPCGELNMIAVSNPCVLDRDLAPDGYIIVHAYGAGNEPYDIWKGMDRRSTEYKTLKEDRAKVLWEAIESIIPDARERTVTSMIGTPLTHERFLRRPNGTYGSSTEDYLKDGSTPFERLVLCGDGVFPGIGVPAVALSGASAANAFVAPFEQWRCLDKLKSKKLI